MPAPKAEIRFVSAPIQPGRDRGYPIPGVLRFPGDPYDPRYPRGRRPCQPCPCPCPPPPRPKFVEPVGPLRELRRDI